MAVISQEIRTFEQKSGGARNWSYRSEAKSFPGRAGKIPLMGRRGVRKVRREARHQGGAGRLIRRVTAGGIRHFFAHQGTFDHFLDPLRQQKAAAPGLALGAGNGDVRNAIHVPGREAERFGRRSVVILVHGRLPVSGRSYQRQQSNRDAASC